MIFRQFHEIATDQKTQTRRIVKPGEIYWREDTITRVEAWTNPKSGLGYYRLKWRVGQTLPVIPKMYHPAIIYNPDHPCYGIDIIPPGDDHYKAAKTGEWGPPMQGYQYLRIRITGIRQERLQDITEEDAAKEGIWYLESTPGLPDYNTGEMKPTPAGYTTSTMPLDVYPTAKEAYQHLWDSINTSKKTNWNSNLYVWVIEFSRVK
jgi:hypothetical protein